MRVVRFAGKVTTTAILAVVFLIGALSGIVAVAAVFCAVYVATAWQAGFSFGARVKPEPEANDLSGVA